MMEKRFGRI